MMRLLRQVVVLAAGLLIAVRRTGLRMALAVLAAVSCGGTPVGAGAQGAPEALSIVGVVEIDAIGRDQRLSTGFVVSADGTVITNSHAVYHVKEDPAHHSLLILYEGPNGREYFEAELVCATRLPYPHATLVPFTKDAAVLRITPPATPHRTWGYPLPGGQRYDWVRHAGPLPAFRALRIAEHGPAIGERVRIPGYGHVSALPRVHVAEGHIEDTFSALDGTPLLRVRYTNMPQPGNSGSPILNERGEVVGVHTWHDTDADLGVEQGVRVVQRPCEGRP